MVEIILKNLDVCSFAVEIISLIVSVAMTIIIYRMERNVAAKAQKLETENAAERFLLANEEEIEYLPLSQAAAALQKDLHSKLKRKHCRMITTRYLYVRPETRSEILRQAGIEEIIVSQAKIDAALKALQEDMQKYRFGRDFLYDNAKYLHRALENYASEPVENCNPHVFKDFSSADQNEAMRFIIESPKTLGFYMDQYIHPESYKADKSAMKPPVDMVWEMVNQILDNGDCNENVLTFWVMRIIIDSCHVFHPHSVEVGFEEYQIQTQEDMYYYTLLTLCKAYAETSK